MACDSYRTSSNKLVCNFSLLQWLQPVLVCNILTLTYVLAISIIYGCIPPMT